MSDSISAVETIEVDPAGRVRTQVADGAAPYRGGYTAFPTHAPDNFEGVLVGTFVTPVNAVERTRTDVRLVVAADEHPTWSRPRDVLDRWLDRRCLLAPWTQRSLEVLDLGLDRCEDRLRASFRAHEDDDALTEVRAGIRQLSLRSPTLPPAKHTNAYIIGDERLIVVDPAPYKRDERDHLADVLQILVRRGATLDSVVLTHHHSDHFGAASWLSEKFAIPVAAHHKTKSLLAEDVEIQRILRDGDTIDLGQDRTGTPFVLDVLHTPGHASGHIVLDDKRPDASALILGDMVAAVGSIIIDPPDGNMRAYIDQLRRLRAMDRKLAFAAHGPPIVGANAKLDHYVDHRLGRERKVLDALTARGPSRPHELLPSAYADTPIALYPLATRACLAHLEKLVEDGVVAADKGVFSPI